MKPIDLPEAPDPEPHGDPLSVAVMGEMADHGYPGLTIEGVLARAGISRADFELRYGSLEECVLDTLERLTASTSRQVGKAFNRHSDWRRALRAAAYEVADLAGENPRSVKFGMVEVLRMENEMARVKREEMFVFCAQMVERGREAAPDPQVVPEGAAIVATGSIIQLLTRRLQEGVEIDYQESARESIYGVVRAYLGEEAAREELEIPPPPTSALTAR
jgi:AcrR family transcriptional regulator